MLKFARSGLDALIACWAFAGNYPSQDAKAAPARNSAEIVSSNRSVCLIRHPSDLGGIEALVTGFLLRIERFRYCHIAGQRATVDGSGDEFC